MHSVYRDAKYVLVIDEDLTPYSALVITKERVLEILFRIATCRWQRRLWTLQEGALSQQLLFVFGDHSKLNLREIYARYYGTPSKKSDPSFLEAFDAAAFFKLANNNDDQFRLMLTAMHGRSTTKLEDQALCCATLLQFTQDQMAELYEQKQDRLALFIKGVKQIPAQLLFYDGPRMSGEGISWCPQSFLDGYLTPRTPTDSSIGYLSWTANNTGVSGQLPGLLITPPEGRDKDAKHATGLQTFYLRETARQRICGLRGHRHHHTFSGLRKPAIILAQRYQNQMDGTESRGLLVNIKTCVGEAYVVQPVMTLLLGYSNETESRILVKGLEAGWGRGDH